MQLAAGNEGVHHTQKQNTQIEHSGGKGGSHNRVRTDCKVQTHHPNRDCGFVKLFLTGQQAEQAVQYAVMVVGSIPVFLMYPFVQKYFVKGVMIGSVKG